MSKVAVDIEWDEVCPAGLCYETYTNGAAVFNCPPLFFVTGGPGLNLEGASCMFGFKPPTHH